MDFKRILRTPMLWIVVLIGAAILVLSLSDNGGFTRIDTSKALDLINNGKVDSAKLINNERMELTLKQGETFSDGDKVKNATKVYAYYVEARGGNVVQALDSHLPPNGYTDQIDEANWFGSMLVSLIPIIIVLGLFWFLMGQMQGGGSRVMQFGKSRAKLASKDTPKVTFAVASDVLKKACLVPPGMKAESPGVSSHQLGDSSGRKTFALPSRQ